MRNLGSALPEPQGERASTQFLNETTPFVASLVEPWTGFSHSLAFGMTTTQVSSRARSASLRVDSGEESFLDTEMLPWVTKSIDFLPPKAGDGMIIDHADGLHKRVADGRPYEFEPATGEFLAHRV